MSIAHLQHAMDPVVTVHQLHQNHSQPSIVAPRPPQAYEHSNQQMMFQARSFESGIGMYKNYLLEPFPNRYRTYLQDWHDNSTTDDIHQPLQHILPRNLIDYELPIHQQQLDKTFTRHHRPAPPPPTPQSTNIIVTNNNQPLCVNFNNFSSDIYGLCGKNNNNQLCTTTGSNNLIVTNRCGSESDIFYLSKLEANSIGGPRITEIPTFSNSFQYGQINNNNNYGEDTALENLMQRNSSFHENFLYPSSNASTMLVQSKTLPRREPESNKLRRSTSIESFFGMPSMRFLQKSQASSSKPSTVTKSGKFQKNNDTKTLEKKKNLKNKKNKLIRSSSHRSVSSSSAGAGGHYSESSIAYSKDDQELRKLKKVMLDDEMKSIYGYLSPKNKRQ